MIDRSYVHFFLTMWLNSTNDKLKKEASHIAPRLEYCEMKFIQSLFLATNQLPLSPVQIQPSPPYYRQPNQDDGRKVSDCFCFVCCDFHFGVPREYVQELGKRKTSSTGRAVLISESIHFLISTECTLFNWVLCSMISYLLKAYRRFFLTIPYIRLFSLVRELVRVLLSLVKHDEENICLDYLEFRSISILQTWNVCLTRQKFFGDDRRSSFGFNHTDNFSSILHNWEWNIFRASPRQESVVEYLATVHPG